jgi:hypothetical protein
MIPAPALLVALAAALLAPSTVLAQEAIATGPEGAPPAAEAAKRPITEDPQSPEAIGRWARGVIAGQPSEEGQQIARARTGGTPPDDRRPHGEVWAGIGTRGYRELGGVVTQPVGKCGSVTIAVDKMESDGPRRRRR